MRKSFGYGGSGGGTGSSGMLRAVQRSVRAGGVSGGGPQEPFSHSSSPSPSTTNTPRSSTNNNKTNSTYALSLSSSTNSTPFPLYNNNLPISVASNAPITLPPSPTCSDEFEWECIDGIGNEDERNYGFCDDIVFGSVPSQDEVQNAVSALKRVIKPASFPQFVKDRLPHNLGQDVGDGITSPSASMCKVSSVESELDWMEPSLRNSRMLWHHGYDRVYDAFHLLQNEPCIQRMVVSLSSGRAIWDAVLNNEVVRELRESLNEAEKNVPKSSDEASNGSDVAGDIWTWIFVNTRAKIMDYIDKITKLVTDLLQPPEGGRTNEEAADPFDEKLRTSFLLSVVVLLIVVVTRAHKA